MANVFVSSPKRQARLAGTLYLVVILAGMFAEAFIRPKIMVASDAAATARNLVAHAPLYRVGLLTDLLTVVAAVAEPIPSVRDHHPLVLSAPSHVFVYRHWARAHR